MELEHIALLELPGEAIALVIEEGKASGFYTRTRQIGSVKESENVFQQLLVLHLLKVFFGIAVCV